MLNSSLSVLTAGLTPSASTALDVPPTVVFELCGRACRGTGVGAEPAEDDPEINL